jgi:hypothetical protein
MRRWENDNLLEQRLAQVNADLANLDVMEHLEVEVDWKSNFKQLSKAGNEKIQEKFVSGYTLEQLMRLTRTKQRSFDAAAVHREQDDPASTVDDTTGTASERAMFLRVEKRARQCLVQCFGRMEVFLQGIEDFLLAFLRGGDVGSIVLHPELQKQLGCALQYEGMSKRSKGAHPSVILSFAPTNPVYRLLTHAACQFYTLTARSEGSKQSGRGGGNQGGKTIRIQRPLKHLQLYEQFESVSLVAYLRARANAA